MTPVHNATTSEEEGCTPEPELDGNGAETQASAMHWAFRKRAVRRCAMWGEGSRVGKNIYVDISCPWRADQAAVALAGLNQASSPVPLPFGPHQAPRQVGMKVGSKWENVIATLCRTHGLLSAMALWEYQLSRRHTEKNNGKQRIWDGGWGSMLDALCTDAAFETKQNKSFKNRETAAPDVQAWRTNEPSKNLRIQMLGMDGQTS